MDQSVLEKTSLPKLFKMARKSFSKGDFNNSIKIYDSIINKDPTNAEALSSIMEVLYEFNSLRVAPKYVNLILKNARDDASCLAWVSFALISDKQNNHEKLVINLLNKSKHLAPNNALVYAVAAFYFVTSGNNINAMKECDLALKIDPNQPIALRIMGFCHEGLGNSELSMSLFKKSLKTNPYNYIALHNLSAHYYYKGDFDKCNIYVRKILATYPDDVHAFVTLALIDNISSEDDIVAVKMKYLLDKKIGEANDAASLRELAKLQFSLGDICDRGKSFERAFKYYSEANKTLCEVEPANIYPFMNKIAYGKESELFPSRKFFDNKKSYGSKSDLPFFVVGVPRCGSTLIEQVLSCHSKVENIGESGKIEDFILKRVCENHSASDVYPEILQKLSKSQIEDFSHEYIVDLQSMHKDASHIVDKTLLNSLHQGMIRLFFPNSRIINCKRHPLDSCLSAFFKDFSTGLNYSRSLDTLVEFYKQYNLISKKYENVLSSKLTYNIYYEAFVSNFETEARSLLNFCNLEWEDECLLFYNKKSRVRTASNMQVREPIYDRSKYRWRNYEPYITTLMEGLKEEIEEYEEELHNYLQQQ